MIYNREEFGFTFLAKNVNFRIRREDLYIMGEISTAFVTILGMGTTFFGLICIIILSLVMSFFCRIGKRTETNEKSTVQSTVNTPKANTQIANKGEFVAAISAAIAEDMGTDISAIRILSIKKI